MSGEKPTSKALQLEWRSTRLSDGVQTHSPRRFVIVGVGGAGSKTVTQLTKMQLIGATTLAIDTDSLHLETVHAHQKALIGKKSTRGLSAHGDPSLGKAAAQESIEKIKEALAEADVVFVTAGLGGGTGTGATPVIAETAKKKGAITLGVVTMPLRTEENRIKPASCALDELQRKCDLVAVIDNNNLVASQPVIDKGKRGAFQVANQVLATVIKNIVETISTPSLINLDFADFMTITKHGGVAALGIGESTATNRAEEALHNALRSPLLNVDYAGATNALIYVSGDGDMTIEEANRVREAAATMINANANVVCGAKVYPELDGRIRVTLVLTGIKPPKTRRGTPRKLGRIAPGLFNLEPYWKPEKNLPVNLNLYQLENFE